VKAIQAFFQEYPQHLQDLSKFKRTVLAEIAIHESLWRYNSKPSHKKYTDHDFCEMLLRSVTKAETLHAPELGRQLEAPDYRQPKVNPARQNSSDKNSAKQMVANPAIQKPS
jgi:hypothetical protein